MATTSVWVQLYILGDDKPKGQPFEIEPLPKNVNALKEAVKVKRTNTLSHYDAAELNVYAANTVVPVPAGKESLKAWEAVPKDTTGETPLIVVAPQQLLLQNPTVMDLTALKDEIRNTIRSQFEQQQQDKESTIVLSAATGTQKRKLMAMLYLQEKGASWPNKPAVLRRIVGFSWLNGSEGCDENRTAYMAYLKEILRLPAHYGLADAHSISTLLVVDLPGNQKISGTTDVAICKAEHITNKAIKNNIETLFELKKPENMEENKDHTPQTIGEHIAASYLNPDHAVVSVLTDLNQSWTFFWFGIGENDSRVALYKLHLYGEEATADAKYLLDSLYGSSVGYNLPTTFANRQPFKAIVDSVNSNKRVRREFDCTDSNSLDSDSKPSPSSGADQHPTSRIDASASSRGSGTGHENNQGTSGEGGGTSRNMASVLNLFACPSDRDVANELDLLDMVDVNEQYEIVRSFALKHIVPYMTG